MRQTLGELCVACHRAIDAEQEGSFCEGCRNPLHDNCRRPGDATSNRACCLVCGINLRGLSKRRPGARAEYTEYSQVPWQRQSWANNLFLALAFFGLLPLAFWTCFNLLTG